jgi:hypothetical protein
LYAYLRRSSRRLTLAITCRQQAAKPAVDAPVQLEVRRRYAQPHLRALLTVLGVSILMAYNENPNLGVHVPIDDRIGKTHERKRTSVFSGWFANVGKLFK